MSKSLGWLVGWTGYVTCDKTDAVDKTSTQSSNPKNARQMYRHRFVLLAA